MCLADVEKEEEEGTRAPKGPRGEVNGITSNYDQIRAIS